MRNTLTLTHLKTTACAKRPDNLHLFEEKQEKPKRKPRKESPNVRWMEERLKEWCQENDFEFLREHKFLPNRKWQFDFALVKPPISGELKIAIEYEGGIYMKISGHNSHTGIQRDIEKYNAAQSEGWKVIRFTVKNYKNIINELEKIVK